MTLQEYMSYKAPGELVKIGCIGGSGFIYAGKAGNLDLQEFGENWKNDLKRAFREADAEQKKPHRDHLIKSVQRSYKKAIKELLDFTPFTERKVYRTYASQLEPCEIIMIDGEECGKRFMCDERNKRLALSNEDGVMRFVGAIYELCATEMAGLYKQYLVAKEKAQEATRNTKCLIECLEHAEMMNAAGTVVDCLIQDYAAAVQAEFYAKKGLTSIADSFQARADWICADEYGILHDPVGVVEAVIKAGRMNE